MNIFILSENYSQSAWLHPKKLLNKMILEHGQILCSVVYKLAPELVPDCQPWLYKKTHSNHPSVLWAGESRSNYIELLDRTWAMYQESLERNGGSNHHKTIIDHDRWHHLRDMADLMDFPQESRTPYKLAFNSVSNIDKSTYDGSNQQAVTLYRQYVMTKPYVKPEDNINVWAKLQ